MMQNGYTVNGRYRIIRPLGEGGMANVYLAQDLILDREVAVKVLRLDLQEDPETTRRFQREAMATTELVHPNIVGIYDVGEINHMQYIVMEYVKGTDLKKYIVEHFPIPYQRVIHIMTQILAAVQTAHDHDIIHRDLKPQNVLIDHDGVVKITDFGIAIALSENSMTQTNSMLGSVHYLSPEQARGSMATKRSDIYSLGVILYEMLTGTVPFEGESAVSIAVKHFQDDVPSVRQFDPRIPQALENVVFKATAKNPNDRYQTATAMSEDLSTALSPQRAHEAKFTTTHHENDATKVLPLSSIEQARAIDAKQKSAQQKEKVLQTQKKATQKKKRTRLIWITIVSLLFIGLIIAAIAIINRQNSDVDVPDVSGMNQVQAKNALAEANLTVGRVRFETSNSVQKNRVITTDPENGTSVKSASTVDLILSSGVKLYTLKEYSGENYADIKSDLEKAGFTVLRSSKSSSTFSKGIILSQNLASGKKVDPKQTIMRFVVSSGPKKIKLENLSGMKEAEVRSYAAENGFTPIFEYENSDSIEAGYVIRQDPSAFSQMGSGDTLTVTISNGPDESEVESQPEESSSSEAESSSATSSSSNADDSSADSSSQSGSSSSSSSSVSSSSSSSSSSTTSH